MHGLLMLPPALERLMARDGEAALPRFRAAREIGRRYRHPELSALAGLGTGQALLTTGDVEAGLRTLDEVMVGVAGGETAPVVTGLVYCAVIIACHEVYEVRRAAEWTRALSGWCDTQPGLVPFRGQCLVHRAQVLRLHGAWPEAVEQIELARARLSEPPGQPAVGMALYELGEMHRLRGEHGPAEDAYAASSRCGHDVQPGLALLRLDQGDVEAALAAVRRAVAESRSWRGRAHLDAARVEIALAAGEVAEARETADAMAATAAAHDTALLRAMAAHAQGAVLLADDDPQEALDALRRAVTEWRDLDAPYDLGPHPAAARPGLPGARRRGHRAAGDLGRGGGVRGASRGTGPGPGRAGRKVPHRRLPDGHRCGDPADLPGARGAPRGRDRQHQPSDRPRARAQREDGGPAPEQHLRQARGRLTAAATAYAFEHDLL